MKKHDVTIDYLKNRIHFKADYCHRFLLNDDLYRIKEISNASSNEERVKLLIKQIL